jgi:hypothetical protein
MIGAWTTVDRLYDPDAEDAKDAVQSASYILWALTGRKYSGVHQVTETYCQDSRRYGAEVVPALLHGDVYNTCGTCGGCGHILRLRGAPVLNVLSVAAMDAPVALSSIEVVDDIGIAAATGTCWGGCGDVTVTYQYGSLPPAAGVAAATELANQLLWSKTDDDRCALPARVTSVSRQGMSWTLLDPQDFLAEGRTGIYQVDLFIKAVNPDGARKRPRVFSPDIARGRSRRSAATTVAFRQRP